MNKIFTILLIDDDAEDKELFREALLELAPAIRCIDVDDGRDAMRLLTAPEALHPDLIFLDLNMPVMDGKCCLQAIKQLPALQHIPVIIYSTSRREEDIEETKKLGAAYFITKPVFFDDISRTLAEVFAKLPTQILPLK